MGEHSPRIFVIYEKLFISVVPEGVGKDLVEFSYMTDEVNTVKAELKFPITEALSPSAPYDHVQHPSGLITKCASCHASEVRASEVNFARAFKSVGLRPTESSLVNLEKVRSYALSCDRSVERERCDILSGVFGNGEVQQGSFPTTFSTFF